MQVIDRMFGRRHVFSGPKERGVTTTEYAIMMVLIALAVVTAGGTMGIDDAVVAVFTLVQSMLP